MTDETDRPIRTPPPTDPSPAPEPTAPTEPYAPPELRRGLRGRILLFAIVLLALVALAYGIFGFLIPGAVTP